MRLALAILTALLLVVPAVPAHATLVSVDFSIAFSPPAGSNFATGELGGVLQLFVQTPGGAGLILPFGPALFPPDPITPGTTFHPPDPIHPPDPVAPGQILLFSFAGQVSYPPDPVEPDPVFAFPPDPVIPDGPPSVPPLITLGAFSADLASLSVSGPLFAFASPGTQVGTYSVTVQVVPSASTFWLVGIGLIALAIGSLRRHRLAT